MMIKPRTTESDGIVVVRDDMFPGGLSSPYLDPGNSAHDAWYDESPLQLEAE
jgi:hypothetical protein